MAAHSMVAQSCLRPSCETNCGRQTADRNAHLDKGLNAANSEGPDLPNRYLLPIYSITSFCSWMTLAQFAVSVLM